MSLVPGASRGLVSGRSGRSRSRSEEFRESQQRERERKASEASARAAREIAERESRQARIEQARERREAARTRQFNVRRAQRDRFTGLQRGANESQAAFNTRRERLIRSREVSGRQSVQRPNISLASGGVGVASGSSGVRSSGGMSVSPERVGFFRLALGGVEGQRPFGLDERFFTRSGQRPGSLPARVRGAVSGSAERAALRTGLSPTVSRVVGDVALDVAFLPAFAAGGVGRLSRSFSGSTRTSTVSSATRAVRARQIEGALREARLRSAGDIRLVGSGGTARVATRTEVLGEEFLTLSDVEVRASSRAAGVRGESVTLRQTRTGREALRSDITARTIRQGGARRVRNIGLRGELRDGLRSSDRGFITDVATRPTSLVRNGRNVEVGTDIVRSRTAGVSRRAPSVRTDLRVVDGSESSFRTLSGERALRVSRSGRLTSAVRPRNIGVFRVSQTSARTGSFGRRARVRSSTFQQRSASVSVEQGVSSSARQGVNELLTSSIPTETGVLRGVRTPSSTSAVRSVSASQTSRSVLSEVPVARLNVLEGTSSVSRSRSASVVRERSRSRARSDISLISASSLRGRSRSRARSLPRARTRSRSTSPFGDLPRFSPELPIGRITPTPSFEFRTSSVPRRRRRRTRTTDSLFFSPDLTSRALNLRSKLSTRELALRTTGLGLRRLPR